MFFLISMLFLTKQTATYMEQVWVQELSVLGQELGLFLAMVLVGCRFLSQQHVGHWCR